MELKLNAGDKIQIPDNCNAIIKDGVVIIEENKPKFKRGDFVFANGSQGDSILIYSGSGNKVICLHFISSGRIYFNGVTSSDFIRFATEPEKQILFNKLHEVGKDWDAEKCEIVDWVWKPKDGDRYYTITATSYESGVIECVYRNYKYHERRIENGLYFRTRELAEAALELLKNVKHY